MLEFIKKVCNYIANLFNVSETISYVIAGAGVLVLLLLVILIIVAICKGAKKSKNKAQKVEQTETTPQEEVIVVEESQIENSVPSGATEIATSPSETEKQVEKAQEIKQEESVKVEQEKEEVAVTKEEKSETENTSAQAVKEEPKEEPKAKTTSAKKTEKTSKKATPKASETPEKPARKMTGKWVIECKREGEYVAKLVASNGEVMLNSEIYSTPAGARSGINTIINGVVNGNFVIYRDKSGDYYFKLKSANNKLLCAGEIYKTKDGCVSAVESVKRIAESAVLVEGVSERNHYIDYTPIKLTEQALSGAKGKWKVEQTENGGYLARLYANNGQLMLATEEVSKKATALNAIESVKKNASEGNFIIDKDKFGSFYYKLRNSQKTVICIGESYDSLDACISALESVRKFALNSDLK